MKTILLLICLLATSSIAGELFRYKCQSCGVTNISEPSSVDVKKYPRPDTASEVNRQYVKTTKTFDCSNCGAGNLIVTRQTVGQKVTDAKVDSGATTQYQATHPKKPPIKIK